jgi:hypothetical protein
MSSVAKVGTPVQFFRSGSVGADPYAAAVTSCTKRVADLVLFRSSVNPDLQAGCSTCLRQWHKEHPKSPDWLLGSHRKTSLPN